MGGKKAYQSVKVRLCPYLSVKKVRSRHKNQTHPSCMPPQKNMPYMSSLYLRAKTNFFPKFFKMRLAIVQKAVYIRKSSVILELNASVDPAKLIKKLWKIFQSWLEKLFEVWYIMKPTLLRSAAPKKVKVERKSKLQKSFENLKNPAWQMRKAVIY